MLVMGINGGFGRINSREFASFHDSAAVLLRDGEVVAAFEEERLNRIKHTNKFPTSAIRACLDAAGATLGDLDHVAVHFAEEGALGDLVDHLLTGRSVSRSLGVDPGLDTNPRGLLCAILEREVGSTIDPRRIHFVKHHMSHALSAFVPSGFDRALVVTMDGQGDAGEAGYVATADERGIEILRTTYVHDSIGLFYSYLTFFLGFNYHDEFKVMGLVPYGDPTVYRDLFAQLYTLGAEGTFEIHRERMGSFATTIAPRHPGQPLDQRYKDVAAALQEAIEVIVFHVLTHYQRATGLRNLCFAGGVAHNCTLNGKILASGLFSRVFVQPASHDAGCSLGAALSAAYGGVPGPPEARARLMPDLYLGTDIGDADDVCRALERWEPLVSIRRSADVCDEAAGLIATGSVIGWVQGRAEFGPRALGNRSILADPRPPANKEIINAMVKKREAFRPFAPAVLAERTAEYFDVPEVEVDLGHMTYVLGVRTDKRRVLGAVTHVDGSARVQVVEQRQNDRFWRVISAFEKRTGVGVLLNTSFNNNAEPIVDSVDDSVVCFLTTRLTQLVVGDFVIEKREPTYDLCRSLTLSLCRYASLQRIKRLDEGGAFREFVEVANSYDDRAIAVSSDLGRALDAADGETSLGSIVDGLSLDGASIFPGLIDLWSRRLVTLLPSTPD